MNDLLDVRALNRATLARQMLLERSDRGPLDALEGLVGLQAQTPQTWYTGLWTRLRRFEAEEVGRALLGRAVVRITLMRGTIHLVTAADALVLRPAVQPALERFLRANYRRPLEGIDADEVAAYGRRLVDEHPRTWAELGRLLAERWPGRDPAALTVAVRVRVPLVQVPPRGVWGRSGPIAHTSLEAWLGRPVQTGLSVDDLVLRYLAAFGPAGPADAQTWSGLAGLRDAFERLRPRLVAFRGEDGRELFDLPDAPRPHPETPAPPRFLYDYDNLLRSHADRTRFLSEHDRRRVLLVVGNRSIGGLLIDGFGSGVWRLEREGSASVLRIELFAPAAPDVLSAVQEEGGRFVDFLASPGADRRVEFGRVL